MRRRLRQEAERPVGPVAAGGLRRFSARSAAELRAGLYEPPVGATPVEYVTPSVEDRAVEVLALLADRGQHRAPSVPDLMVAAVAESAGLTVLHDDKAFELIAEITRPVVERLVT